MYLEALIPGVIIDNYKNEFIRTIEEGKSIITSWLQTLVAFSNTEGGTLYVGVDNKTHKIFSLDHSTVNKTTQMVHQIIKERIEPKIKYNLTSMPVKEEIQTRYVLKIDVEKNKLLPVTLHADKLLGIYIRNHGRNLLASFEQIRELVLLSDNVSYDKAFTENEYKKDEFIVLHDLYKKKTNTALTEKDLISIGFMNQDKKLSKGALLFSDNYNDHRTKIVCTLWPSTTKGSSIILATDEYCGNILNSIQIVILFIQNHSANGFIKEETGRKDYFSYPLNSITQCIVNAFAYRNYFITEKQIEVNLFIDRLEITSPGSLLGIAPRNKETNISSLNPKLRNKVISNTLKLCHLIEENGSPFDKIETDYISKGEGFKPFISSTASSFTLVLPNLTYPLGVIDEEIIPNINVVGVLSGKYDLAILSFCFSKPRSAKQIANYIGIKPSTYFRNEIVEKLINQDYLKEDRTQSITMYLSNSSKVFSQ